MLRAPAKQPCAPVPSPPLALLSPKSAWNTASPHAKVSSGVGQAGVARDNAEQRRQHESTPRFACCVLRTCARMRMRLLWPKWQSVPCARVVCRARQLTTLQRNRLSTRTFLAARSRWTTRLASRCIMPWATSCAALSRSASVNGDADDARSFRYSCRAPFSQKFITRSFGVPAVTAPMRLTTWVCEPMCACDDRGNNNKGAHTHTRTHKHTRNNARVSFARLFR